MSEKEIALLIICTVIKLSRCQYLQHKSNDKSICDGARDTRSVEHFFNLIFAEFHNAPPLCTCVQMCLDQPIYCYPSGCMKTITKEPILTHIQKEDKRVTLVIKDRNVALFSNLMEDSQILNTDIPESTTVSEFVPNILKDRYKILSQYKKTPKVELRYNFRQHVDTRKSAMSNIGNAVVPKSRWPNRQSILLSQNKANKIKTAKFLSSVYAAPLPIIAKFTLQR